MASPRQEVGSEIEAAQRIAASERHRFSGEIFHRFDFRHDVFAGERPNPHETDVERLTRQRKGLRLLLDVVDGRETEAAGSYRRAEALEYLAKMYAKRKLDENGPSNAHNRILEIREILAFTDWEAWYRLTEEHGIDASELDPTVEDLPRTPVYARLG